MNALNKLVHGITSMIRADRAAVLAPFATYRAEHSAARKPAPPAPMIRTSCSRVS